MHRKPAGDVGLGSETNFAIEALGQLYLGVEM
jgi:hypothetical protein